MMTIIIITVVCWQQWSIHSIAMTQRALNYSACNAMKRNKCSLAPTAWLACYVPSILEWLGTEFWSILCMNCLPFTKNSPRLKFMQLFSRVMRNSVLWRVT